MSLETIFTAQSDADIDRCFETFHFLRPHIEPSSFLTQIRRQQQDNYQILALAVNDKVLSVAGYRISEFLAWGKILYIDDLSTHPEARGKGYASRLLDELVQIAKTNQCAQIHLDSGHQRFTAHKLYLNKGFQINSHHFSMLLESGA